VAKSTVVAPSLSLPYGHLFSATTCQGGRLGSIQALSGAPSTAIPEWAALQRQGAFEPDPVTCTTSSPMPQSLRSRSASTFAVGVEAIQTPLGIFIFHW
jgi:hypothetical protein